MKPKTILLSIVAMMAITAFVFQSCKKDDSNDSTPPIGTFMVTPNGGNTSTNFLFDASGCTDNETPTDQLQVRWDFDGDDSWDTNWETNKTQSHKYSSEATYSAKLEVKDNEGLTSQFTKSVKVDNSGGGTPPTGYFTDSRDGKEYAYIEIGSQTWMAENLNYSTENSWWYDNNSANGDFYGRLYTWEAALTASPSGWHLPSDNEWKTLEMSLGMSQTEADKVGLRGTDQGKQMKSTVGWNNNGNGTNSSGLNALPGGLTNDGGPYYDLGLLGHWWSSTESLTSTAYLRYISHDRNEVGRDGWAKLNGLSVRCVKD